MILAEAAEIGLLAYQIYPKSKIDLENLTISGVGVLLDGEIVLSKDHFPVPTVFYDFSFQKRHTEAVKNSIKGLKSTLKSIGVRHINPLQTDKLASDKHRYSKVLASKGLAHPQTKIFNEKNLFAMLKKHEHLYLKPTFGKKGSGIIVVFRNKTNHERFNFRYVVTGPENSYEPRLVESVQSEDLLEQLAEAKTAMGSEQEAYIVQSGIEMLTYGEKEKLFHVRAMTVRGEHGLLQTPLLVAIIGGNRTVGGYTEDCGKVVSRVSNATGLSKKSLFESLKARAIQVHKALESEAGEAIGDLGHDLVFNKKGEVIVIESNVKSGQPVRVTESKGINCDPRYFGRPAWMIFALNIQTKRDQAIAQYAMHLSSLPQES